MMVRAKAARRVALLKWHVRQSTDREHHMTDGVFIAVVLVALVVIGVCLFKIGLLSGSIKASRERIRYLSEIEVEETAFLRRVVDLTWNAATESTAIPSTLLADGIIERARESA
jgi:hypothetical protein